MVRNARLASSLLYGVFFLLSVMIFLKAEMLFGTWSWQSIALLALLASVGAIGMSYLLEYTISMPLRALQKKISETWATKKTLPDSVSLPSDLQELLQGFAFVVKDSEEKIAALGEIQKLDDAKYEFIAIANHQLRTPLTELRWAVATLANTPQLAEASEARELIKSAQTGIDRIVDITTQFLAVAELSSSAAHASPDLNFAELLEGPVARLAPQLAKKHMEIHIEKDPAFVPMITADPRLIEFVLDTLLVNAVVYGHEYTNVSVRLRNKGATVEMTVEDTGIIVSPEEVPLLFEKFFRGSSARKIRPDGSGLALYLCKRILEQEGSTIAFSSSGEITTFIITLPLGEKGQIGQFMGTY